jgi:hypothetical protein
MEAPDLLGSSHYTQITTKKVSRERDDSKSLVNAKFAQMISTKYYEERKC